MTYEQAKSWATKLGIEIAAANSPATQCWIDRVDRASLTGKKEDIEEANRYSGSRRISPPPLRQWPGKRPRLF